MEDQQAQMQAQAQLQAASQAAAAAQQSQQGEDGPKSLEDLMAEAKVGDDGEEWVQPARQSCPELMRTPPQGPEKVDDREKGRQD